MVKSISKREKSKAMADYSAAVFKRLRCVSPVATSAKFHDAVNEVIMTRKKLAALNIELTDFSIIDYMPGVNRNGQKNP